MNVRNGAAYLREALDSVIAQTFGDWELIVWDDCSTDESAMIVAEYLDARIRYFLSTDETPLGHARDLAIRQAKAEWSAFLVQDDIWVPDKLEQQIALVEGEPAVGIVYGRTVVFSEQGNQWDYDHRHEFRRLPEGNIFTRLFTHSCFISMSSAMLRRSAIISGIPDEIQVIPDYYLFVAVARHHWARAVQDIVCRYRLHTDNMSHFYGRRIQEEALLLIGMWANYLEPQIVARRRAIHHTLLAVEEVRDLKTASRGIARLLAHGSICFLFTRPFARAYRAIRRRMLRPRWAAAIQNEAD
jgi:glycosyltransferase involved in cell wall biosynthesis